MEFIDFKPLREVDEKCRFPGTMLWVNTVLGNLKGNIKGVTRWVSRGHLDRYLAEFCYRFNRRFDLKAILPRLLAAAVSTPAMPQRLLKVAWMAGVA